MIYLNPEARIPLILKLAVGKLGPNGNNHQAILFGYHIAIHRKVQIAIHPKVQLAILEFRAVK